MMKVIIMLYFASLTAMLVCCNLLGEYVSVSIFSAIPAIISAVMIIFGFLAQTYGVERGGKIRLGKFSNLDFKYYKTNDGKGAFDIIRSRGSINRYDKLYAYIYYICGLIPIPFVFFFSTPAKLSMIAIFLVVELTVALISIAISFCEMKRQSEIDLQRQREHDRELEYQRRREQMGRWK